MSRPKLDLRAYQTFLVSKGFGARPKPLSREQVRAGRELRLAHKAEAVRWPNCTAVAQRITTLPKSGRIYTHFSNGRIERGDKRPDSLRNAKAPGVFSAIAADLGL